MSRAAKALATVRVSRFGLCRAPPINKSNLAKPFPFQIRTSKRSNSTVAVNNGVSASEATASEAEEPSFWERYRKDIRFISIVAAAVIAGSIPVYVVSGLQDDMELRERIRDRFPYLVSTLSRFIEVPDDYNKLYHNTTQIASDTSLRVTIPGQQPMILPASTTLAQLRAILEDKGFSVSTSTIAASMRIQQDGIDTTYKPVPFSTYPCLPYPTASFYSEGVSAHRTDPSQQIDRLFALRVIPHTCKPLVDHWMKVLKNSASSGVAATSTAASSMFSASQRMAHEKRAQRVAALVELRHLENEVIPRIEEENKVKALQPTLTSKIRVHKPAA